MKKPTLEELLEKARKGFEASLLPSRPASRHPPHPPQPPAPAAFVSAPPSVSQPPTRFPQPPPPGLPADLRTRDGWNVEDRTQSHNKLAPALLSRVLEKIEVGGRPFQKVTVDMGEVVGESTCLRTTPKDIPNILFARRPGRTGLTRFIQSDTPNPSSLVTVILKKMSEKEAYVLISSWVGGDAEVEPWDPRATPKAKAFWRTHALRFGTEAIEEGSQTRVPPSDFTEP